MWEAYSLRARGDGVKPRLFNMAWALSLLLCIASGVAWVMTLRFAIDDPVLGPGLTIVGSIPPLGWLCVLSAPITIILFWRQVHRGRIWEERVIRGHCPACGYDLAGNVSGVCPECGTTIPTIS